MPVGTGYSYSETQEGYYSRYIAKAVPQINIKGYVIASPDVDTYQYINTRVLYAYHMTLIPKELYESLEENCKGNYANIDPDNTKCLSDYEDYSQ
ncbi:hypothetical protein TSUD_132360, partial [Trifolium subterraneum]